MRWQGCVGMSWTLQNIEFGVECDAPHAFGIARPAKQTIGVADSVTLRGDVHGQPEACAFLDPGQSVDRCEYAIFISGFDRKCHHCPPRRIDEGCLASNCNTNG